jgi:hypothetical protein
MLLIKTSPSRGGGRVILNHFEQLGLRKGGGAFLENDMIVAMMGHGQGFLLTIEGRQSMRSV